VKRYAMTYVIMGGNGEIIEHFMVDYWMETLIEAQIWGVIEDALRTQNSGTYDVPWYLNEESCFCDQVYYKDGP